MQLRKFNRQNQTVRDLITPELFDLRDEVAGLKIGFLQGTGVEMGMLVTMTTRKSIHTQIDMALRKLKRHQTDFDLARLTRLVKLHLRQIKWMNGANLQQNRQFYTDMLNTLEFQFHWMAVLTKNHSPSNSKSSSLP